MLAKLRNLLASILRKDAQERGASAVNNGVAARYFSDRHRQAMDLAHGAHLELDDFSAELGRHMTRKNKVETIACSSGCHSCCSLYVSATPAELLLIEGYLARQPEALKTTIHQRVERAFQLARGKSMDQRSGTRVRCPMLNSAGQCDIYPVRPLTCRAYVSFSLPACIADAKKPKSNLEVPRSGTLDRAKSKLFGRVNTDAAGIGSAAGTFELIQAMHRLLSSEDDVQALADGGNPLLQARSR